MSASQPEEKPRRLAEMLFRMIVLHTYYFMNRGLIIIGHVESGVLNKGEAIIIEGHGKHIETADYGFIHHQYANPFDRPPDIVDLWFRGMPNGEIKPGMIITKQGES